MRQPDPFLAKRLGAVVLCGGLSRRMGRSKALLSFGDESLLERTLRCVSSVASAVVVSAAADQALPPLPPSVILVRDVEPRQGPLQGVALGLAALPPEIDWAFVCGCDLPLLDAEFVRRLHAFVERDPDRSIDAALANHDGRWRPLPGLYRTSVFLAAQSLFASGERRLGALADVISVRALSPVDLARLDPSGHALLNANTPDDYRRALHIAGLNETEIKT